MFDVVFIGLSLGSILLLVALGLAITYGSMGVINMAHGELLMVGAYTAVLSNIYLDLNLFWAIPVAFVSTGLVGWLIERIVVKPLYGRMLDTLLATWGVAILLQQLIRLEFGLTFFDIHLAGLGPGLQQMAVPEALKGTLTIGDVMIQLYRSFIILVTVILALMTWWLLYRTSFGLQLRAVTRNPDMAAACGINVSRIKSLTFAYGSGLAGVAGVMLSGFKTVSPDMGAAYVIDGFMVVVVGGVGSLLGTMASALSLGQLNGVVAFASNDILARAVIFAVVVLMIIWRPNGLFSFKGR